ncbi:P-loop NTPase family protein [Poriferisphaera corsica]|uniref:hypothetical protein n=1 Tax=Poriferisphaera corsica TaxID=2528020 RepID=UPI0011A52017|nr:hypothetical protein [Poriferisphaera corsica]
MHSHSQINLTSLNRITIIGCCGGGKSTLAKQLAQKLNLPLHDLDDIYWHENWVLTPREKRNPILAPIIEQSQWIIDSNYASVLLTERFAASDLIIHVDLPTWFCLFRITKRSILQFLNVEHSFPARIQEAHKTNRQRSISDFAFYKYVYTFKRRLHPHFEKTLTTANAHQKLITLKSKKQIKQFFDSIPTTPSLAPNTSTPQ